MWDKNLYNMLTYTYTDTGKWIRTMSRCSMIWLASYLVEYLSHSLLSVMDVFIFVVIYQKMERTRAMFPQSTLIIRMCLHIAYKYDMCQPEQLVVFDMSGRWM